MPNTRSGASRTREGINEQIDRQIAGALGARTTAKNLELLMRDGGGQEECLPLSFNETEGVVGLTHWFEKMETNSHKRTIGIEVAYAMSWTELMKLMTEVYCPRNEVQKMETEL
ncbi:hypothetical protein Tco_0229777 [Tanacetum coccineum]